MAVTAKVTLTGSADDKPKSWLETRRAASIPAARPAAPPRLSRVRASFPTIHRIAVELKP
jgi:hypothetical protein